MLTVVRVCWPLCVFADRCACLLTVERVCCPQSDEDEFTKFRNEQDEIKERDVVTSAVNATRADDAADDEFTDFQVRPALQHVRFSDVMFYEKPI